MQVVVKAAAKDLDQVEGIVTRRVAETLGPDRARGLEVRPVFPGVTTGRRAGLFMVEFPKRMSVSDVEKVLEGLRRDSAFEFAELPAAKTPR